MDPWDLLVLGTVGLLLLLAGGIGAAHWAGELWRRRVGRRRALEEALEPRPPWLR